MKQIKSTPTAIGVPFTGYETHSQLNSTTKKEQLLSDIRSLSTEEVMSWIDDIYSELEHLKKREDCFFLHDRPDGWIYVVVYEDGSIYRYCKGEKAYDEYLSNSAAIEIQRYDSNDLFPKYETILEKQEGQFA